MMHHSARVPYWHCSTSCRSSARSVLRSASLHSTSVLHDRAIRSASLPDSSRSSDTAEVFAPHSTRAKITTADETQLSKMVGGYKSDNAAGTGWLQQTNALIIADRLSFGAECRRHFANARYWPSSLDVVVTTGVYNIISCLILLKMDSCPAVIITTASA